MQQRVHPSAHDAFPERASSSPASVPANKARQGIWGVQVLAILAVSLALVGLVWLALGIYGGAIDNESTGAPGAITQPQVGPPPAGEPTPADTP